MKIPVIDKGVDDQLVKRPITWQGQAKGALVQSKDDPSKRVIYLRSDLTPTDKIHTLSHELGHAKLHDLRRGEKWSREIKETQAELTGYTITKSLGIDPGQNSIRYIQNWSKKLKALEGNDAGKIIREALQASTDVTHYLSDHLLNGMKRQPTMTKLEQADNLAVMEQSYQEEKNSMQKTMNR